MEYATRVRGWRVFDAALAGVLTLAAVGELTLSGYPPLVAGCAAVVTVALNWRRAYPLAVMAVTSGVWTVPIVLGLIPGEAALTPLVALLVAVYSVARHAPTRSALLGGAIALAASLASDLHLARPSAGDFGFTVILISWPWFAGFALRGREIATTALAQRAALLEAERDAQARAAVVEERARIARELHDIIAHSVSVMVVQAGAAEQVVARTPERAVTALQAIAETGRDALVDLRRLLGLLRQGEMPAALAPRPGVADLDTLIGQVRDAGLPVSMAVEGTGGPLPPGVDLTVYRVVQEALTNTLKHAGPAHARVALRYRPDAVQVTVTDTGCGGDGGDGSGHGITGMRERLALYGGDLTAGPGEPCGYRVDARIPLGGTR
jgi:signal transduction histidine kinase